MLRSLVKSFQCSLVIKPLLSGEVSLATSAIQRFRRIDQRRGLFSIEARNSKEAIVTNDGNIQENVDVTGFDAEDYIVPYNVEREKSVNTEALLDVLRERFRLTPDDVKQVMSDAVVARVHRNRSILLSVLDTLALEGVTKRSIIENPWILTIEKSRLDEKLALIRIIKSRDINHFVPFLRLSVSRIRKLVSGMNAESSFVPFGNRIYYISEKLKLDPKIVSKYLPKRLFVLEMPFEMLEQNLNHMIRYNVSSLDVLKDLWAFRYTPKSVELRLERAKRAKKNKIMPWMVRCPEPILQRSLQLTLNELAVLNGKKSVIEYVAERLEFDVAEANSIMAKHPQVYRVRVTKIKEVLDYLLDEAGFTRYEIAQVPRILCHSLDTTKKRLDELKSINCRPSSLIIVCRSKREYEKFIKSWKATQTKHTFPSNQVESNANNGDTETTVGCDKS